jgi:hypothetical protein
LIELRCAIEQLGGALTPAQQHKYQEAREPLERWRRERAMTTRPDRAARPGRGSISRIPEIPSASLIR